jgi:hypothetical protein
MHAAVEELWEAVFPVSQCGDYVWRIETQASQSRDGQQADSRLRVAEAGS